MVERLTFTDTHCHLDFEAFAPDRDQVLEQARQAGLVRILNPGIDLASSREAARLAQEFPEVYAAVGIHPNSAALWDNGSLEELAGLVDRPGVVAIGEIGLDFYRDRTPPRVQEEALRPQLDLVGRRKLPVVLHNRQATEVLLSILVEWRAGLNKTAPEMMDRCGVLHSYSGDLDSAFKAIDLGFYIGFTGPITFKNAGDLQQVVAGLPLERLLIETDAPFLAPHPYRGQRNVPAHVRLVAEKVAELKNQPLEIVASTTMENARRLFRWGDPG